jgi:hypothetical protein
MSHKGHSILGGETLRICRQSLFNVTLFNTQWGSVWEFAAVFISTHSSYIQEQSLEAQNWSLLATVDRDMSERWGFERVWSTASIGNSSDPLNWHAKRVHGSSCCAFESFWWTNQRYYLRFSLGPEGGLSSPFPSAWIQTVPLPQKVSLTTAISCEHYVPSQRNCLVGMGGGKHSFLARCTPGVAVESPLRRILWTTSGGPKRWVFTREKVPYSAQATWFWCKLPKRSENRSHAGAARRSMGGRAALEMLPKKGPGQSNTAIWFHTILTADPIHTDSIESTEEKGSRPGMSWPSSTIGYKLIDHIRRREATT